MIEVSAGAPPSASPMTCRSAVRQRAALRDLRMFAFFALDRLTQGLPEIDAGNYVAVAFGEPQGDSRGSENGQKP